MWQQYILICLDGGSSGVVLRGGRDNVAKTVSSVQLRKSWAWTWAIWFESNFRLGIFWGDIVTVTRSEVLKERNLIGYL